MQGMLNEISGINGIEENYKDVLKHEDDLGTWKTHNHYPVGWAWAMDSPFQWMKQVASHYGGTANGMVISWPAEIKDGGGMRTQWHHVIDIVPTILDVLKIEQPSSVGGVAQKPIEGVSMAYTFDHPNAPSTRHTQYFEMMGNRGIYHDGWVACTTPVRPPWEPAYLWQFAPFNGRWKPLRVIGPSGRTPAMGTRAMCDHMKKMCVWTSAWAVGPMADGYDFEVTEFGFDDDGGVCYEKDGVKVTHWRRSHGVDSASAYRLDWNGLSFVWTGDGKPDKLTAKYAKGVDVFVTEMAVDMVNLWALKQGVPPVLGALTIDNLHTPHYAVGYLSNLIQPRLAMATHVSFDRELIGEMMAGVRTHYKGFFALGIDHTVVNATKDRVWIREAAFPESTNTARPSMEWFIQNNFGGNMPEEITVKNPLTANQEKSVRDLEIDPSLFTPTDQVWDWARMSRWPAEVKINQKDFFGGGKKPDKQGT